MWLFELFKLFYIFCVSFLPVIVDTGVQVWNGIEINSKDFGRTEEWSCTQDCSPTERTPPNTTVMEDMDQDQLSGLHAAPATRLIPVYSQVGVTEISVKTGDESSAESDAGVNLEICDGLGTCCHTLPLDNTGNDRKTGQTDVYSGSTLSDCSQYSLDPSGQWTAQLILEDTWHADNAWYVDWIRILTKDADFTKKQFNCDVGAWLRRGGDLSYTIVSNCQEMDESFIEQDTSNEDQSESPKIQVGVNKISVKTGNEASGETDAVADVKICDGLGACCRTLGLNNAGNDRKSGATDVYSDPYYLSNCSESVLDPFGKWTAQLHLPDNSWSDNAWFVDWIRISTKDADFNCTVGDWLERNSTITSKCQKIVQRTRRGVQARAVQDFVTVGLNDNIRFRCKKDEFECDDGITCLTWDQLCDKGEDCPQHENGGGGEHEGLSAERRGQICTAPHKPEADVSKCSSTVKIVDKNEKKYVKLCFRSLEVLVGLQTVITFGLLQLPAVSLALYGVICAFRQSKNQPKKAILHKITDSLLALTIITLPYCVTELFTLVQFQFADKEVEYLVKGLKSLWSPVYNKIVDLFPKVSFDLFKFLPNKDLNGRERALSVGIAKLIAGSFPQLVFQAVLLGGYTTWSDDYSGEKFPWSQAASILSSALMIAKITAEIVIYQRETEQPNEEVPTKYNTLHEWFTILVDKKSTGREYTAQESKSMYDRIEEMVLKLEMLLKAAWEAFLHILPLLPLILSSLIFNTGTLVLTIIVTEWYSAIYIGIVLILNVTISFSLPFSLARRVEKKLGVSYRFSTKDEGDKLKEKETRILRGIFATWANMFVFIRPVENMSYHKIVHVSLLQPLRFIVNIVTLIIVCHITWTAGEYYVWVPDQSNMNMTLVPDESNMNMTWVPYQSYMNMTWVPDQSNMNMTRKWVSRHKHNPKQTISLILTFAIVLATGVLNMVELRYFYKKEKVTKPSNDHVPVEEEEMKTLSPAPLLLHSTSVFDEENLDAYLDISPLQTVPSQPVNLSTAKTTSNGQFTLTTTRQSKQSVTSVTSRKSVTSVSQLTTVQEGVQLEGALADEKSPLLSIAEGAIEKGNPDNQMVPFSEEGFETNEGSPVILTESPDGEMSVSETEVVGPDGTVYTKKVSVRSVKKLSINGKDVDLDNLDDPNSNLTDEEKRQIQLACQNQGMMTIEEA